MSIGVSCGRALILQFESGDPPEHLAERLSAHGVSWEVVRLDEPHEPISLAGVDMLSALGGSMNIDQIDAYPFLQEARDVLAQALERRLPYLGICLGGQLLARVLGAEVVRAPAPEVGVVPVQVDQSAVDPLLAGIGPMMQTLQFHLDTFQLPPEGVILGSSVDCARQIMRCGECVYALQFHPETSAETFASWVEEDYVKSVPGGTEGKAAELIQEVRSSWPALRRHADRLLDNFIELARQRAVTPGSSAEGRQWT